MNIVNSNISSYNAIITKDILIFLKLPSDDKITKKIQRLTENKSDEKEEFEKENLLCCQCYQIITSYCECISIQEQHKHIFANPHGIIYDISCFRSAPGCLYTGIPTKEWSWFSGFLWKIAICSKCLIHLGWQFIPSSSNNSFVGLVSNRLVTPYNPDII